ncbi:CRISPR-associated CARF protein Csx1 [Thermococcus indicus]|uniref:CRISPR-associated CARF protein Csx1 n=1 Tax=Thermococcus indicus TaxID=2586643 RepID=UPI00143E0A58|nr:CRISPR-associated CARF protein Csx1 [Thermococcus indicus]
MKRVLVATWGNPFQWEAIEYSADCKSLGLSDCQNVKEENVSTLPVLLKALKPQKTIILVLDTLANLTLRNDVPARKMESYDNVKADVEERVRWFIENRVNPYMSEEDRALLDDVEIVVLPGVGEFSNVSVEGDVLDFYSSVLKVLAERLPVEDTEVILDLTHGINFMPVLTYRALNALLGILAYLRTARLYVVNSEPFPQGEREWKEKIKPLSVLNMKLVEYLELRPRPLYSTISSRPKWSAFISSVTNGFPLAFATFYPSQKEVEEYLEREHLDFLNNIVVSFRPDPTGVMKLHVLRGKSLSKDFRTAVKLHYMLRVFGTEFKGYPKKEVTLDELVRITNRLFSRMPRIGIVVGDQLRELCRLIKGGYEYVNGTSRFRPGVLDRLSGKHVDKPLLPLKRGKKIALGKLRSAMRLTSPSVGSVNPTPDIRNFIAHSGFEYNLVFVRYDGTDIYWSYGKMGCGKLVKADENCESRCARIDETLSTCSCSDDVVVCFLIGALKMKNSKGVVC